VKCGQEMALKLWSLNWGVNTPQCKRLSSYRMLRRN